jgi:hypothetical protein
MGGRFCLGAIYARLSRLWLSRRLLLLPIALSAHQQSSYVPTHSASVQK